MPQSPFQSGFFRDPIAAHTSRTKVAMAKGVLETPDGRVFKSPSELTHFMADNPAWVSRHRDWLRSTMGKKVLDTFLKDASSIPKTGKLDRGFTPVTAADRVAAQKIHDRADMGEAPASPGPVVKGGQVTATSKQRTSGPPSASYAPLPKGAQRTSTGANPTTSGGGRSTPSIFDAAIKGLLGLDPSVGQIDARAIMDLYDQGTQSQMQSIRDQLTQLPQIQEHNLGRIQGWYDTVGQQVDKARQRGVDMTSALAAADQSNAQGLMASLGGEANPANASVGQVAQSGVNTLNAMGAADAQYLADIGPLLQGEAASMKDSEIQRLAGMQRDYNSQLAQLTDQGTAGKADLALKIAQMNQDAGQQSYQNRAGLMNTVAGLALSGQKLDASTMQFLADYQRRVANDQQNAAYQQGSLQARQDATQQSGVNSMLDYILGQKRLDASTTAAQQRAGASQVKSVESKIQKTADDIGSTISLTDKQGNINPRYAGYREGGLAPQALVKDVLNTYRQNGADLSDPRVRKAAVASIQRFGVKVDPNWVNGWR